jgi:predicted acyl esterase
MTFPRVTFRRVVLLATVVVLGAVGYYLLSPPAPVHEFSVSKNLRAPNETLRARIGNDYTEIFPLPADIKVEKDVGVLLPDGMRMSVNIYRPDARAERALATSR